MPFDRPDDSMKAALAQLKELRPEFLLFSEALSEVTICGEGLEYSTWTCSRLPEEDDRVILKDSTSTTQWKLFRKEGQIPEEFCRDRTVADKYNIIVALREEGVSEPANLYSFFPTSVPLPLPVLCHATLELEQNRKHFQEIESNRFVLKELAEHLLDIAKEFLSIEENLWCGIDIINPQEQGKFPTELNILDKHLVEAAKSRKLIPTLSGRIVKPDNAVLFQCVNTDWLPRRAFGDVAKARNPSDHQFFHRLGVPFLTPESFRQRIEKLNDLTVTERVELVIGIICNKLPQDYCTSHILIDSEGKRVTDRNEGKVFLPREHVEVNTVFPEWAQVKMLHSDFWYAIQNEMCDERKDLIKSDLKRLFAISEYSLESLVVSLVSSSKKAIDMNYLPELVIRTGLLCAIFNLFKSSQSGNKRPDFPDKFTVLVSIHDKTSNPLI